MSAFENVDGVQIWNIVLCFRTLPTVIRIKSFLNILCLVIKSSGIKYNIVVIYLSRK